MIIGVFDAREYRIPNYLVLFLLFLAVVNVAEGAPDGKLIALLVEGLIGFLVTFVIGIILYAKGVLAAGDVKLISVVAIIIGYTKLVSFVVFVAFSCLFIGTMYWLLNQSLREISVSKVNPVVSFKLFNLFPYLASQLYQIKHNLLAGKNVTYMPFAPVFIVALAMFQYFEY